MSHKIDGLSPAATAAVQGSRVNAPAREAHKGSGPVGSVAAVDSVALTADAQNLQRLEQAIANRPEVDEARVEKIRAQLRDGTYVINPGVIASQLARMEWELSP